MVPVPTVRNWITRRNISMLLLSGFILTLTACSGGIGDEDADGKGDPRMFVMEAKEAKEAKEFFEEEANTEAYAHIKENPFQLAAQTPLSTFSIDVDTASYSNVRRFLLQQNQLPPKDAVRIEELVNYFTYRYPQPTGEHPVAIASEVGECPWDTRLKLVCIGLQAKSIHPSDLPGRNLVFLLDTSGSMQSYNKLPLLRSALTIMTKQLRPTDRVAIVAYAGSAGLVLPSTPGNQQQQIVQSLNRLSAGGSTNGGQGIELAYQIAQQNYIQGGVNRVIIGTDGDFNVGTTSEGGLVRLIEQKRKSGIYLSVLGFGMGNLKDSTMEKLAHHGNGHYAYIDSVREAHRVFVTQGMAMYTVANNVKVQVEFNPARVSAYRLLGYENRLMKAQDFNDETKDAGDLGAGHQVTALYAIAPPGVKVNIPNIDPLKYQNQTKLNKAANSGELLNVKVRYTKPGADKSRLLIHPVQDAKRTFAKTSSDFRFAAAVASFGMLLRDSQYKGTATLDQVGQIVQQTGVGQGERSEFLNMVKTAGLLSR